MANKASTKADVRSRKERAAAIQAAQKRRQRSITLTIGAIVAVVVVVLGLLVVRSLSNRPAPPKSETSGLISAAVAKALANVPASVTNAVGAGPVKAQQAPKAISGQPPLTADGKARVLYVGAEYCPYCAAERWPLTVALSRFGSFKNLGQGASSDSDAFPGTRTLDFHGATYTSDYLSFTGYETADREGKPVDKLSSADEKIFGKYNSAPYVDKSAAGTIPFVDLGNEYLSSGASYDVGVLEGLSHAQIAKALSDPSSKVAQGVVGSANVFTAAMCKLTDGKPGNVCSAPGVTAAAKKLG